MESFTLPHSHGNTEQLETLEKELEHAENFETLANLFKQLSDPTRMRIFWLLSHTEQCVINISAMMNMSSPAVSHHLRTLRSYGLINSRRDGKEVYYRASDHPEARLLHKIIEEGMAISCPQKNL